METKARKWTTVVNKKAEGVGVDVSSNGTIGNFKSNSRSINKRFKSDMP